MGQLRVGLSLLVVLVVGMGIVTMLTSVSWAEDESNSGSNIPNLCVAVISCNRTQLLEETLSAILEHLTLHEPSITSQTLLIDQGSPALNRAALNTRFPLSVRLYASEARGYGFPFNVAFVGRLCRARYLLLVEDDFPFIRNPQKVLRQPRFVAEAMALLQAEPRALGVVLKSDDWLLTHEYCQHDPATSHRIIRTPLGESRTFLCLGGKKVFGSYTNSAAVYDLKRLVEVGEQWEGPHGIQDWETPEGRMSLKAAAQGKGLLFVERYKPTSTNQQGVERWKGVAIHTGAGKSTGGSESKCRRGEEYILFD